MSLYTQIKEDMKQAMRDKDQTRLMVLRGLISSFNNEIISKNLEKEELSDEEALALIGRAVKQRKDSIEQFRKGGREDLAENEETELKILSSYMPEQMSEEEVAKAAVAKKAELDITDKTKMGMLMGALMKDLKGKADGNMVKSAVEKLFNQ